MEQQNGTPVADRELAVETIQQNPYQPRKEFDSDELAALSASIKAHGILQPLVVRQVDGKWQLIAGERRLRAAQSVGLKNVPVRVVKFNEQETLEAALAENIQRSDLNPIEKALAFKEYLDRFKLTLDQLAERLGLSRSNVSNLVHLLDLHPEVQDGIRVGQISEAHAKLIKGIKNKDKQKNVFKQIVALGLSVKASEALIRDHREIAPTTGGTLPVPEGEMPKPAKAKAASEPAATIEKSNHVAGIENELRQKLGTHVEVQLIGRETGRLVLMFATNDDFERLVATLRK